MDVEKEAYLHRGSLYTISAVYASCIATTLAALFWLLRLGISDNSPFIPIKAVTLSYFLLFFPGAVHHLLKQGATKWSRSIFGSYPALLVQGVLLLIVAGGLAHRLSMDLMPVFIVAGLALFLLDWRRFFLTAGLKRMLISAFFAFLFALWVSKIAWANTYQHPLYLELIAGGVAHIDTLFHSSIAGMIGTYGIPSTGLDGVPWVQNHFGSHWIFAHVSQLLQMSPLQFYNVGYQVVFLPLLFHSMILLVIELKTLFGRDQAAWNLGSDRLFWLIFFAMTAGFLPPAMNSSSSIWNDILVSESYCVAMTFAFLTSALLLHIVIEQEAGSAAQRHTQWFLAAALPALAGFITLSKGSIGVLFIALLGYLFLRLRLYRDRVYILSGVLSVIVFLLVYQWINPPAAMRVAPFDFIKTYVIGAPGILPGITSPAAKVSTFLMLHYAGLWIYLAYRASTPDTRWRLIPRAGTSAKYIDVEILIIMSILGFLPGAVLAIPGASAVYFSDIQRWFSLVLLLATLPVVKKFRERTRDDPRRSAGERIRNGMVVLLSILVLSNLIMAYRASILYHLDMRHDLAFGPSAQQVKEESKARMKAYISQAEYRGLADWLAGQAVLLKNKPAESLRRSGRYQLLKNMQHLDAFPEAEKRKALMYIPGSNRQYWEMLPCKQMPFLGPALLGIAMARGLPEKNCNTDYYGFSAYEFAGASDISRDLTAEEVLSYARSKGFSEIIVMDNRGDTKTFR